MYNIKLENTICVKVAEIYEQLGQRQTALLICILQFFWLALNDQYSMFLFGPEHVQTWIVFIRCAELDAIHWSVHLSASLSVYLCVSKSVSLYLSNLSCFY